MARQYQLELFPSCLYCGSEADTKDHVPPKLLLERPFPPNLSTVPSCKKCNQSFSKDEQYFLVAMSQVGFVETLKSKLDDGGVVDRALTRSPGFDERIVNSLRVDENGMVYLEPEIERFDRVSLKVAYGLFFITYQAYPSYELTEVSVFHGHQIPSALAALIQGSILSDVWPAVGSPAFKKAVLDFEREQCWYQSQHWITVQNDVFAFMFRKVQNRLLCIMNFHNTICAVVQCPLPRKKTN